MKRISWILNRVHAMTVQEITHRAASYATLHREKQALQKGWTPIPPHAVSSKNALFIPPDDWLSAWRSHYVLHNQDLEKLLLGQIDFFGRFPLTIGEPVNWHRDPNTGKAAPRSYGKYINYRDDSIVGDIKVLWELGRHQHLIPLAVAYAVSGEMKYRTAVVEQIEGWIKDNSFGMGIHWCSALEVALRVISWIIIHGLFALRHSNEGLFAAVADKEKLGWSIYQHAYFISNYLSLYSSANNHLIGELVGLWATCQIFNLGADGERWAKLAYDGLEREAELQIYQDGVDKEQAFYYHLWVLEYLLFAWLLGNRCGQLFSDNFRDRIIAMAIFLSDVTPSGGQPPQIGDSDNGFVTRFEPAWPSDPYRDVLASAEVVFNINNLCKPYDPRPEKSFWYGLIAGQLPARIGNPPEASTRSYPRLYPDGGYAVLGDELTHLVFDAGSLGYPSIAAHGHADALSVCLAIEGKWWLVDPGTYAYHSEPAYRNYFRSTSAHNTLTVNDADQSEMGGPFLWLKRADAHIQGFGVEDNKTQWVSGSHAGYKKRFGVVHSRKIQLSIDNREIKISDAIEGKGKHKIALYFHFSPDIKLMPGAGESVFIASRRGSAVDLLFELDTRWRWETVSGSENPLLGWYSSALGVKQPCVTLRGIWNADLPLQIITVMRWNTSHLNTSLL